MSNFRLFDCVNGQKQAFNESDCFVLINQSKQFTGSTDSNSFRASVFLVKDLKQNANYNIL